MKTQQVTINTFPEPIREPLKVGDVYFIMSIMTDYILEHTWLDTDSDFEWLDLGLIQKTYDGAEQHRQAVLSITAVNHVNEIIEDEYRGG
jgi:hypothetical protein